MTRLKQPGKWRARIKAQAARTQARRERGESIKQMWADSAALIPRHEARRDGVARVPESMRVDRPAPDMLVEVGASSRAWFRQKQRDAAGEARRKRRRTETRDERNARLAVPQPSRRERILAEREGQA